MERKAQLHEQENKVLNQNQIARSMSLVPNVNEKEAEKHFLKFEKVSKSMEWTTDMYCLFLQSILTPKAKDVHYALSTAQCSDYGLDKERIARFSFLMF